jgi:chromosome segregation ATPase
MFGKMLKGMAIALGAGIAAGVVVARRVRPPAQSHSSLEPVLERLDRVESRIAAVEALPVAHADDIAALVVCLDNQSREVESLQLQVDQQRREIATRIGTVEKNLTDLVAGLPNLVESIVEPRVEDLSLRLRAEIQQAVHATLTTFERAIEDKVSDRIAVIEKAMLEQSAAMASFRQRVRELDQDIERWTSSVERLVARASHAIDADSQQPRRAIELPVRELNLQQTA